MIASVLLVGQVGQQRQMPGALDGERKLALLLCAVARNPTGDNLAPLGDEALEKLRVLVVDDEALVGGETTDLPASDTSHDDVLAINGNPEVLSD